MVGRAKRRTDELDILERFEAAVEETLAEKPPLDRHDLAIGGYDLMKLGIAPDPLIDRIQERLLAEVLENPTLNTAARLLSRAK